jgi:hypothetical protein
MLMAQFVMAQIEPFAHTIADGRFILLWRVPQVENPVRTLATRLGTICFRRLMRRVKRQNKSLSLGTKPSLSGTLLPCGCLTISKPIQSASGTITTPSQSPTEMPDKYKPPYTFSTHIGAACAKQFRTFADLAEKLKMPVEDSCQPCRRKKLM